MSFNSSNFFEELSGFHSFSEACNPKHYHTAPNNWLIVLTDIKGSTSAIEKGRYKDVNMVGAACITAVINTCKGVRIPFVFGGDGATFLIPPNYRDAVEKQLLGVARFSKKMHNLKLRSGIIPILEVEKAGKKIEVAKYIMDTGAYLAMFNGGGVSYADELLKSNNNFLIQSSNNNIQPNLEGLSCRWHPIMPKGDTILSLLVMCVDTKNELSIYNEINTYIADILGHAQNPINKKGMTYTWPGYETLRRSQMVWKQGNIVKNILEHIFLITLFNIMERYSLKLPGLDVPQYTEEMIMNSDYKKFDDMLRMVIDCTKDQATKIIEFLEAKKTKNQIVYGTHYSKTALVTCFLESLQKDKHIHFVDGNDGGYALAAKELKKQLESIKI